MSHETRQLANCFECLLPYTISGVKDFLQFDYFKQVLYSNIFCFEINFNITWLPYDIFFSLVSKNLINVELKLYHQLSCFIGHPVCALTHYSFIYKLRISVQWLFAALVQLVFILFVKSVIWLELMLIVGFIKACQVPTDYKLKPSIVNLL